MKNSIVTVLCFSFIILVSGSSAPIDNPNANGFKTSIYTIISSSPHNYASQTWYYFDIAFSSAFSATSLGGLATLADVCVSLNINKNILISVSLSSVNTTHIKIAVFGYLVNFANFRVSALGYAFRFVDGTNIKFQSLSVSPFINITSNSNYETTSTVAGFNLTGNWSYALFLYNLKGTRYGN